MPGSQCRYCGETSVFWSTIAGRPVLHNAADRTPHHCEGKRATAPAAPAVPVKGKRIVGLNYKPFVHQTGCPGALPWEECACQKVAA